MKQIIAAAAMKASTHFISQPQNLFDEFTCDAGAKQHAHDYPIQEVLNLRHALVPITQRTIYAVVSFSADGFMHGKPFVNIRIHLHTHFFAYFGC
jgi:hypothetical protein